MGFFKNVYTGIQRTKSKIEEFAEKQAVRQDEMNEKRLIKLEAQEKRLKLRKLVRDKENKISKLRDQLIPKSQSLFGGESIFSPTGSGFNNNLNINTQPRKRTIPNRKNRR